MEPYTGTILPLRYDPETGEYSMAMPGMLSEMLYSGHRLGERLKGERPLDAGGTFMDTLEFGVLSSPLNRAPAGSLRMMAGPKAKTANLAKKEIAESLAKKGASRDEIWRKTGWFQGPDKKWRFEIDDSGAMYRGIPPEGGGRAEGIIHHPKLYENYPQLKDVSVREFKGDGGSFSDIGAGEVRVGVGKHNNATSTGLHEMQHAVQSPEGFARGGNQGDAVSALLEGRNNILSRLSKEIDMRQKVLGLGDGYRPKTDDDVLLKLRREYDYLMGTNPATDEAAFDWYKKLAGEAEARMVQKRMNLTPAERAARAPWLDYDVPEDQMIVRMRGDGAQASKSLPMDEASRMARKEKIAALRAEANANRAAASGAHRPPMRGNGAPSYDLTGKGTVYPDDIYSPNAAQYYGTGDKSMDMETLKILNSLEGKPDKMVTIYRAVPASEKGTGISLGDWVTVNKNYAKTHGEGPLRGDYAIIQSKVRAKDIYTNGDSIHEFGFDPAKADSADILAATTGGSLPGTVGLLNKPQQAEESVDAFGRYIPGTIF